MGNLICKFTIPLKPVTKKNNMVICRNQKTGRLFIKQNDAYCEYERECAWFIPKLENKIDERINIKAAYYVPDNKVRDITNLHSALHDVLVKNGLVKDDRWQIVAGTDGSRVFIDKKNPRTEVEITRLED